jgi:hypothetical protein
VEAWLQNVELDSVNIQTVMYVNKGIGIFVTVYHHPLAIYYLATHELN